MPEELNAPVKNPDVTPKASPDADLSAEIIANVETHAGETVRCVRVYGDHYRCNWWGNEELVTKGKASASAFEAAEQRVRRSRFLKVRKTPDGLQIQDVTSSR
jgi:hypothetical protein